jgi:hypothetical protein|tara:strand:+ start:122 stop:472 length:351 start_codon:yes stop_codon:yes gene_type:complete
MANKKIQISKSSFNSREFKRVVDTEFKTFAKPIEEVDTDTVEELFRLYDKLFYTIPVEGEDNSHQYLLRKSSEITNLDNLSDDIEPFLNEIAQLRQQLLEANETIFNLENNIDTDE